MFITRSNF